MVQFVNYVILIELREHKQGLTAKELMKSTPKGLLEVISSIHKILNRLLDEGCITKEQKPGSKEYVFFIASEGVAKITAFKRKYKKYLVKDPKERTRIPEPSPKAEVHDPWVEEEPKPRSKYWEPTKW